MAAAGPARLAAEVAAELARLGETGLLRRLEPARGLDFVSNDYLGLAADPEFAREVARRIAGFADQRPSELFAPASRLLRGETEAHRRLEARLAAFKGTEAALLLPSGWQANAALLGALAGPRARVVSDRLNHASLIDAVRSSAARREIVPHLDLDAYERALRSDGSITRTLVVVESLYSMDGDLAPLSDLAALCERHGAHLLVDEAHATGVYGPSRGSGWIEESGVEGRVTASVTTFGKALALQGGAVAGPRSLIDLIVNRGRSFVFSTALSPLLVAALDVALDRVEREPERRLRARASARLLRERLRAGGVDVAHDDSPIVPVILGTNERALATAARLSAEGLDVRAVRPPTVPVGTARLRVSVHADHSDEDLDRVARAILEAVR